MFAIGSTGFYCDDCFSFSSEKKYSNLCALCEKPEQCDYPDRFSGYDGAIRCLDKGQGDVAFTKVHHIKKYFGVSNPHERISYCHVVVKRQ